MGRDGAMRDGHDARMRQPSRGPEAAGDSAVILPTWRRHRGSCCRSGPRPPGARGILSRTPEAHRPQEGTTVVDTTSPDVEAQRDAFADRLFASMNSTFDLAAVYLGDRLGLYRALDAAGSPTAAELAHRTGLDERYVREWLEHGAVTGILETDDGVAAADRRYRLP